MRLQACLSVPLLFCPHVLRAGASSQPYQPHHGASFGAPVQILRPVEGKPDSLEVVESGVSAIETLQGPVAAIAVVGPYHSGKSFFLNSLISSLQDPSNHSKSFQQVFEVGRNVDPTTRGVWAYHRRVKVKLGDKAADRGEQPDDATDVDLLFLDTEGFAAANVSERYDGKVFAASTVLSSLLIYNSMHLINAKELEYLDLLAHNTQLFTLKTATNASATQASPAKARGNYTSSHTGTAYGTTPTTTTTTTTCSSSSSSSSRRSTGSRNDSTCAAPSSSSSPPTGDISSQGHRFSLHEVFNLPPLLWTVQAFTFELVEGETCTDWLKRMLADVVVNRPRDMSTTAPSSSRRGVAQKPKLGLDGLFPSIECQALWLPTTSRDQIHRLRDITRTQLTPEYLSEVAAVRESVLTSLNSKTRAGRHLTGADFGALVRLVVKGLEQNALPDVPSWWEPYADYLRVSSVKAAAQYFEAQVEGAYKDRTPPLPAPAMKRLLSDTRTEALKLLPRLLMGMGESVVAQAKRQLERALKDLAAEHIRKNEERVREYLSEARQNRVDADSATVAEYARTELPKPSHVLTKWISEREKRTYAALETEIRPHKDEPKMRAELSELQGRCKRHSRALVAQNTEALEHLLTAARATCLQRYTEELESAVGEDPVPPSVIDQANKGATKKALDCLASIAPDFHSEKQYKTHLNLFGKSLHAHVSQLHRSNSERVAAYCDSIRSSLVTNASAVLQQSYGQSEEMAVRQAINSSNLIARSYWLRVGQLATTEECKKTHVVMLREMADVQERAREAVAREIKAVLREPLQEICKTVVEAKCQEFTFMSDIHKAVDRDCIKWVRRNGGAKGASLSKEFLRRVLDIFIAEDLRECVVVVKAREQAYQRTVNIIMTVAGVVLAVIGAIVYLLWSSY